MSIVRWLANLGIRNNLMIYPPASPLFPSCNQIVRAVSTTVIVVLIVSKPCPGDRVASLVVFVRKRLGSHSLW